MLTCSNCGTEIVAKELTCPNCGGIGRNVLLAAGRNLRPTDYFLDNFVAPKLSQLTKCGARDLGTTPNWLGTFILRDVFQGAYNPNARAFGFNFIRIVTGERHEYEKGRQKLHEHLATPRSHISAYFEAILSFEICISQSYQALKFLMTFGGERLFDGEAESNEKSLNEIYNTTKHMDERIQAGTIPKESTSGIWITDLGLESHDGSLSFVGLAEVIDDLSRLAGKIADGSAKVTQGE